MGITLSPSTSSPVLIKCSRLNQPLLIASFNVRDFQEINYPKKIKRQHLFGNDNYCDSERKGLPLATPS
ncbi:MAG: hypothetical protein MJK14_01130, partial [Rivularia sp. ALOHA_DT_140]|nr:hypothetical protein [Rivularia sp. ALOHA_DT_140]